MSDPLQYRSIGRPHMPSLLNILRRKSGVMSARYSDMRAKSGDMAAESSVFSRKSSDMAGEFSDFSGKSSDMAAESSDFFGKSSDIGPEFCDFSEKSGDIHAGFNDSVVKSSDIASEFSDFTATSGDYSEKSGDMAARSSAFPHASRDGGKALGGMANIAATKGFNAAPVEGAGVSATGPEGLGKRGMRSFFLGWRIWNWFAQFLAAKEPARMVDRCDVPFDELFVIEYVSDHDCVRMHDGIIPDVHDLLKHIPLEREVPRFDRNMVLAVLLALAKRVLGLADGISPQRLELAHALSRRAVLELWAPRGPPRSPLFWNVR
jgi:hypothetical protein